MISEYVANSGNSVVPPCSGSSQPLLCAGSPATTGTAEPAEKPSVVSSDTSWLPTPQYTVPSTSALSTSPTAVSCIGSVTCSTTSVSTRTVVSAGNAGGAS